MSLTVWLRLSGRLCVQLNKPSEPPRTMETAPLSPGEVYYEPTGGEPATVTNTKPRLRPACLSGPTASCGHTVVVKPCVCAVLYVKMISRSPSQNLDEETAGALNGGAAPVPDSSAKYDGHHVNDLDSSANISRGESFVSSPMYV